MSEAAESSPNPGSDRPSLGDLGLATVSQLNLPPKEGEGDIMEAALSSLEEG